MEKYNFCGWATKNDIQCTDGRIIRKDAFAHCDGLRVPLVWNHNHDDPYRVIGHAVLENREEGVYTYGFLNDTDLGKTAKVYIEHGDITQMSIYANKLKQQGPNVMHGTIREVSLVLAGANPGACIENVIKHGEECDDEATIWSGEDFDAINGTIEHSEPDKIKKEDDSMLEHNDTEKNEKTIKDVYDAMSDEQKDVVHIMVAMALEEAGVADDEDEEEEGMKHNVWDNEYETEDSGVLSHADEMAIVDLAKKSHIGTLQNAIQQFADDNGLQHADLVSGFAQEGPGNVTELFPEYKDLKPGAPELITKDQGWISTVMSKVHKSPISRVRTSYVDIRKLETLRARGYTKGKEKQLIGQITLAKRTTDPQTVYVKSAVHRDDVTDIVDFDYIAYLYNIDRMVLNEELATAIMLGDGRDIGDEDKIHEDKIRPIWTDDELYTHHIDLDIEGFKASLQGTETNAHFGPNYIMAEAMVDKILHAKENYKGTGTPDMYITPYDLNVMLLAKDMNGRRIYSSRAELASVLGVNNIYTCEQFAGKTRQDKDGNTKKLVALIVNLADYSLGATKGGEITHFTQFDIDFNQHKSLLETRCSGALTKLDCAIALEVDADEVAAG